MEQQNDSFRTWTDDASFVRKTLIVLGLLLLAALLWQLSDILLLAFGAILVAIILRAFADILSRYLHVPARWSLMLASVLIFVALLAVITLFGVQIRTQFANVAERLPAAIDSFSQELGLGSATDGISKMLNEMSTGGIARRIAGIGGTILGGLGNVVLVVIAGLYIAASPRLYVEGFIKLFPRRQHRRVEGSLRAAGHALRLWLAAQMIAMIGVALLSATAFRLIGLPSPYALGLIAGLMDFIPFLGPFLGAAPAVMIAFTISGEVTLWTVLAVLLIQQIEGNVIQPLVARSVIAMPPALALFAIVAGGVLFGSLGLVFGYPLAVVVYVLVKKLYVRETLGETTKVPGEADAAKAAQNSPT